MATSLLVFRTGLYEEHVDETSFLYSQRQHLLKDAGFRWRELAPFERRLEVHLDALVIGADLALEVCQRRAGEDPGNLYAAISLFCRRHHAARVSDVLGKIQPTDADSFRAVTEALKHELPIEWVPFVERALARQDPHLVPALATACGYRRIPCVSSLVELAAAPSSATRSIVEALGKLRAQSATSVLQQCLRDGDSSLRAEALLALLRIGVEPPIQACYLVAQRESWPRLALGLAGDAAALHVLTHPAGGEPDRDGIHAIGLLGMPRSFDYLCDCLNDPSLADTAAQALNWICGADLYDDMLVEEMVNEDELFPRELKSWRERRERPRTVDGKPFGTIERKLVTDPERWRDWIGRNASLFEPQRRYRSGSLYSPQGLVQSLAQADADPRLRALTAVEMLIRYECDVPLEIDMPVVQQVSAIRRMADWSRSRTTRFEPGEWYLHGAAQ